MKQMIKSLTLVSIMALILGLGGCAQNKAVIAGDEYFKAGKYQLAVEAYSRAMPQEPDNEELHKKSIEALNRYHQSLDVLLIEAQKLEQQKKHGTAMFLYGKVASANYKASARTRYNQLKAQIRARNLYKLNASYDKKVFGKYFLQNKSNIQLVDKIDESQSNEMGISMKLASPKFHIKSFTKTGSGKYVSGKQQVTNPSYTKQEDEIESKEREMESKQAWVDKLTSRSQNMADLQAAQSELAQAQSRLRSAVAGSPDHKSAQANVKDAQNAVAKQKKRRQNIFNDLATAREDYRNIHASLAYARRLILTIPTTIWVDAYKTHTYPIFVNTQHINALLSYQDSNGKSASTLVRASFTNQSHDAQPIIRVSAAPRREIDERELVKKLHLAAQEHGEGIVDEYVDAYRNGILTRAEQSSDPSEKLELWINYALVGSSDDVSHTISTQVREQLSRLYGHGADFDLSKILFL